MDSIRKLVSGNRRRFTEDNINLDLTYITPNIIAMSYPSSGLESMYRNPIERVSQKCFHFLRWQPSLTNVTAITTGLSTHQSEPLMINNVTLGAVVVITTGLIITVHLLTISTGFAKNRLNGSSVSHIFKSHHIRGPTKCDCCSLQLWKRSNRHCNLCNFVVYGFLQLNR